MSEQFSYLEAGNSAYVLAQSVGIGRCGAITDYSPAKWVYIGGEGTYVHIGDAGGEILFHVTPKYDIKTTVNDLPKISSLALQGDSFSTSNIKQNIIKRDVSDILSILDKMDIYDYNYIPEIYNGKQDYGYIIDYLEKIPGIEKYLEIAEEEVKGYKTKSIFNSSLIKFLLSSVIALNKEIKKIKGDK